jgi:hypothetical protein
MNTLKEFINVCMTTQIKTSQKSISKLKTTTGNYNLRLSAAIRALNIISGNELSNIILKILYRRGNENLLKTIKEKLIISSEKPMENIVSEFGIVYKKYKKNKAQKNIIKKGELISIISKHITRKRARELGFECGSKQFNLQKKRKIDIEEPKELKNSKIQIIDLTNDDNDIIHIQLNRSKEITNNIILPKLSFKMQKKTKNILPDILKYLKENTRPTINNTI